MFLPNQDIDSSLVLLLQQDSTEAFNTLYWKYHTAVYKNIFKLTKDTAATEDILQETFINLWQKRKSLSADKSIAGWIFVVSYHKSVNWQKRKLLETKAQTAIAATQIFEETTDAYELQLECLESAVKNLSPQKRKVFELCKIQGKTYDETARELNISKHTVKEYLAGAITSVKAYIHTHPEYRSVLPLFFLLIN